MISEEFKELVAKDVKGEATDDDLAVLRGDFRSWLVVLNSLKRDVEIQLTAFNSSDASEKSKKNDWRLGAIRFMVSVESKIQEVKSFRANDKTMTA